MATADDKVKNAIQEGTEAVDDKILAVAEKASEVNKRAGRAAVSTIDDGRDAFEHALTCGKAAIRSKPITAVAVVAVLAYLCGRLKR